MVKYSKKNGAIFDRRFLSWLFGKQNARPDEECWELEKFVVSTIAGWDVERPNFYVRHAGEFYACSAKCGLTPEIWQRWFTERQNGWAVVEQQRGAYVWTWFQSSRQMGSWVSVREPCPIIYKLVRREDGKGFNKVLIEI
jgi:hypothetical protein